MMQKQPPSRRNLTSTTGTMPLKPSTISADSNGKNGISACEMCWWACKRHAAMLPGVGRRQVR